APAAQRAAGAERLAEAAAQRPAVLAAAHFRQAAKPLEDCADRLVAHVANRVIDLLDAGSDVADMVDVEALLAGPALRHVAALKEAVDTIEIVAEHPHVWMPLPGFRQFGGKRSIGQRVDMAAAEALGGKQREAVPNAELAAHREERLDVVLVVFHEHAHDVHLRAAA